MSIQLGLKACLEHHIQKNDLATAWKNEVPVLATPILLWLAELCCMKAIKNELEVTEMSLGTAHRMQHLAPTPLDYQIKFEAILIKIEGKKLVFSVIANDSVDVVYTGEHERFIVNKEIFLSKVQEKTNKLSGEYHEKNIDRQCRQ